MTQRRLEWCLSQQGMIPPTAGTDLRQNLKRKKSWNLVGWLDEIGYAKWRDVAEGRICHTS
jgi:hypothetical protein